jgi:hypothetical protein
MVSPFSRLAIPIAITRPGPGDRVRDISLIGGLLLWLAYTRIYWALHVGHWVLPPCPFFYLTGHPCPFCGGTRSFAYMWQGDMADAVRLYPLGPALFAGSMVGVIGLTAGMVSGRSWSLNLSSRQWRLLTIWIVALVALSWVLKVFVLGN